MVVIELDWMWALGIVFIVAIVYGRSVRAKVTDDGLTLSLVGQKRKANKRRKPAR